MVRTRRLPPPTPDESRRYCRRLAERHYENFTVASRLLPRRLRQHVCNIYAYCRWADDLADETGDPQRSLALLDWWEDATSRCYQGRGDPSGVHCPSETIREFNIPIEPFLDLLAAFRQDQQVTRYETIDQLLEYCRYSANPVGRLVLYLGRCHTPERARLSDSICTGLQLANFCQDVARDWDRGRIYLPQADCRRFGYDEACFARRECNEAFRRLLAAQVDGRRGLAPRPARRWRPRCRRGCGCRWHCSPPAVWLRWRRSAGSDSTFGPGGRPSRDPRNSIAARLLVEAAFRRSWTAVK